jgi:molybdenum cofactor cytidylyltransferase
MIFAVVPAAGQSTRMGRPKLALPFKDKTVLDALVQALRHTEVDPTVVVVGPHVSELAAIARAAGAEVCFLERQTADMRATVEAGLEWLEARWHPRADDCWLLVPADHPRLDPDIIHRLIEASREASPFSIWVPTYQGKRGHPTLARWAHVPRIRAHRGDQGLNAYFREYAAETQEVPVASAAILEDLDTPEDYERLRARHLDD